MVVPCLIIFAYAFFERGVYGGVEYDFTFENFSRAVEPVYFSILATSTKIATLATLIALLIGYPAAYAVSMAAPDRQIRLLVLVMLPFWSNYLIRTYAWIVLLNREGLINKGLSQVGLISEPLDLLYNQFAIVTGLVYNYLPFVILAIYSSIQQLDRSLIEASTDLGAPRWRTFLRGHFATHAARGGGRGGICVCAVDRKFHHPGFAGRRPNPDGGELDLRSVFDCQRLAFRCCAFNGSNCVDDAVAVRPGGRSKSGTTAGQGDKCLAQRVRQPGAQSDNCCLPVTSA